ncbi:hypothetical protein LC2W_2310 [Lacticaseibacillus paracasei]|uniref:Uncharacterized protein n=1 Tax=Lacticaseibacillus paracasei subsp. paracasei TaxID=47714 RepID=A0AAP9HIM1_LACPA|nr:hypothetical protein LCAZH_2121 [Lacticaseibacillus paracasei]AEA54641.1 hypothetical protein LC2W_2310 [Lacticaseibacillus paracasei]AEA57823.1 hypothetical protein LCBD_2328 [Lacticaseibacillus paracasei]EPC33928.1 hypothetical protein Lpp223_1285 [Lacticaseibacillus paracasei subsp. paracasei Lpp223]QGV18862.1 Hypothetical protein LCAKO_2355 [Lacticaseibacillus paracasei subsp. paracasei]
MHIKNPSIFGGFLMYARNIKQKLTTVVSYLPKIHDLTVYI